MKPTILIVDDEPAIRQSLRGLLEDEGYQVLEAKNGEEGLLTVRNEDHHIDAVLLDIWMGAVDGIEVLQSLRKSHPALPIIMLSGHANIETAVKATKLGAYHFVEKPFSADTLLLTLRHAIRETRLETENLRLKKDSGRDAHEIIGNSPVITRMVEEVKRAAQSDAWVLIQGENGTGKEAVAHLIHNLSARAEGPFVEVNSAAIPEELIESELFGHEAGAFTGATGKKIGKFDQANDGTLLLDEIGDMSLKTQAKILRVLQEQRFERVGGAKTIQVNVRVIAASNKRLEDEIKAGAFREDLYYRLAVLPLEVPPLRDRAGDVPLLVNHFLQFFTGVYGQKSRTLHPEAMGILERYQWPGNVRELRNIVERMVIMTSAREISRMDIPPAILMAVEGRSAPPLGVQGDLTALGGTYREAKEAFERGYVKAMLARHGGNISKTAEAIQLERSNLHKKIKLLNIELE
ncbi:MAG: sigma-54 dependent transcriptional regulator [Deltaproteobacteria bacterium]|nr:sigma-54 dependent transcriptional regulator [Deltaproteobacteria bacterium]